MDVLEHRKAENDVERGVRDFCQGIGQFPFNDPDIGLAHQVRGNRDVDEGGRRDFTQHRSGKACLIATAEVTEA